MPSRLFLLVSLLLFTPALHSQSEAPARYQLSGGYSYLSNSLNGVPGSHKSLNGWDGAVAFTSWHSLRFKVDVSGYKGTNLGSPQNPYFILGGAQYNMSFGRETVFAETLIGVAGANKTWGTAGALGQTASFASLVGGGLDTRLTPRLAFRAEGGYQYSYFALEHPVTLVPYRIPGLPTNFARISGGLVLQF